MKILNIFLFLIFSASCAQRIKVPINRLIAPQTIGGGATVEYRQTTYSAGVLDFTGNSTSNPLVMGSIAEREFMLNLGAAEKIDIFLRVPKQSSSLIGIKAQIIGGPAKNEALGHTLAMTFGMGSERDEFDSTFKINLKSDVSDYSLIHGYRFTPNLMIYDGISLSNYHFQGEISGTTTLDSDIIDYEAGNILGGHIGVIFGGATFNMKAEWAMQKIKWSHTEEKHFQAISYSLTVGW